MFHAKPFPPCQKNRGHKRHIIALALISQYLQSALAVFLDGDKEVESNFRYFKDCIMLNVTMTKL